VSNLDWKQVWLAIEMYIVEIHLHVSNLDWIQDWSAIEQKTMAQDGTMMRRMITGEV
jgi:hypothetical protein